jgi:hypothetical protein
MLQRINEAAPGVPRAQFTVDAMEENNHGRLRTAKAADKAGNARPARGGRPRAVQMSKLQEQARRLFYLRAPSPKVA